MSPQPAEALNPTQLYDLRREVAKGRVPRPAENVRRLLATLDLEPDPNRIGAMRPLPEDLMERVRGLAVALHEYPSDTVEALVRLGLVAFREQEFLMEKRRYTEWASTAAGEPTP